MHARDALNRDDNVKARPGVARALVGGDADLLVRIWSGLDGLEGIVVPAPVRDLGDGVVQQDPRWLPGHANSPTGCEWGGDEVVKDGYSGDKKVPEVHPTPDLFEQCKPRVDEYTQRKYIHDTTTRPQHPFVHTTWV